MDTRLMFGAVIIAISIVGFAICYLGARNPLQPKWTSESIMGNVIIPMIVGGFVIGPMFFIEYFIVHLSDLKIFDLLVASSVIVAALALVKMMRINKRIAAYEKEKNTSSFNDRFTTPQGGKMGMQAA